MKTAVVGFVNTVLDSDLDFERRVLKLLNDNSVIVDDFLVFGNGNVEKLHEIVFSCEYDALFFCDENNEFLIKDKIRGFGLDYNLRGVFSADKFVCVVDENLAMAINEISESFQKHFRKFFDKTTFKLYGQSKSKILEITDDISKQFPCVRFVVDVCGLDGKCVMLYDNDAPKIEVDKAIKTFILTFKNSIYAETDVSLEVRLNDILRLRRMRIATAESMTGGLIASKIVSVEKSSDLFFESLVTYNTNAKEIRLGVEHGTVVTHGVVSSEVAYEMARGLLKTGNVNCAISITGYAGATRDDSQKPEGLCYIGIGIENEIEVYNYTFSGDRKQVIEQASNAALFLMIKSINNL